MDVSLIPCDVITKEEPSGDNETIIPRQKDISFQCDICQKQFEMESKLLEHECYSMADSNKCDVDQKPIPCNAAVTKENLSSQKCEKRFSSNQDFKKHLYKSTGVKPITCDICKKSFFYKKTLVSHLRTHTKGEMDACGKCPDKVQYSSSSVSCKVCQVTFCKPSVLNRHIRTAHANERPYACEICHKSFKWKQNLREHLIAHTEEKPYVCKICTASFSRKKPLDSHLKLHSEEELSTLS